MDALDAAVLLWRFSWFNAFWLTTSWHIVSRPETHAGSSLATTMVAIWHELF
jgi:hypothetical protein